MGKMGKYMMKGEGEIFIHCGGNFEGVKIYSVSAKRKESTK